MRLSIATLRHRLKDRLVRATGASLLLRLGNRLLTFATFVLVARLLGVADYGQYSFMLSLVTTLSIPAQFGLPAILIREVSKARAASALDRVHDLKAWAYRTTLLVSVPIALILMLVAVMVPGVFGRDEARTALWGAALVIFLPLSAIRSGIIRGLDRVVAGQAAWHIIKPGVLLLLLLAMPLMPGLRLDAGNAMAMNIVATLISWIYGAIVLRHLLRDVPRPAARGRFAIEGWRSSLLALGLANGMFLLDGQIGTLLLGLLSNDAEVGLYKVAAQGALFASMGYSAANAALTPNLARSWAEGDRAAVQRVIVRGARLSVLYAAPVMLVLVIGGALPLGLLFGADFAPAWPALALLVCGQVVNCMFGSATALLNMTHNERANTRAFAIALGFNIVATLPLAHYGATGAAVASTASVILRNLLLWRAAHRLTGIETACWGRLPPRQSAAMARAAVATSSE